MLNTEVKHYIDKSVLCWLATASIDGQPNVSPKEVFTYYSNDTIIIANIASPQTVKNIKANSKVCISFIDVLVQKGFQLKGMAKIIDNNHIEYQSLEPKLLAITKGKFPFKTITKITVETNKKIIAPSYLFYPETTTEALQIEIAKKAYGLIE